MEKQKRYCLFLNNRLWIVLKILAGDSGQSLAEVFRLLIIQEVLSKSRNLDAETQTFVLNQLKLAIEETSDEELNAIAKSKFLKILTLRLSGA